MSEVFFWGYSRLIRLSQTKDIFALPRKEEGGSSLKA